MPALRASDRSFGLVFAALFRVIAGIGWLIRRTLEQHGGRRTATARKLGITREGLYK